MATEVRFLCAFASTYRGLIYLSQIQHLPDAKSFDYVELLVGHQQARGRRQ